MELVRYYNAKQAVAEYKTVDDLKDFRDKAVAVQAYAKQANDYELERDAAIARVRAERKCGELLRDMEKNKGAAGTGKNQYQEGVRSNETTAPTLSDMGVTKDQSSKWQKLAEVPEDVFESVIDSGMKVSGSQVLNTANPPNENNEKIDVQVLWFWGRLRDMEKDNIFNRPLSELVDLMTDGMKPDAIRILPKLRKWLNDFT